MKLIFRWSSDTNNPPQFITVKLDKPAIVTGNIMLTSGISKDIYGQE